MLNFIEITLRYGCSFVNILHIFRNLFSRAPLDDCSANISLICKWKKKVVHWNYQNIAVLQNVVNLRNQRSSFQFSLSCIVFLMTKNDRNRCDFNLKYVIESQQLTCQIKEG